MESTKYIGMDVHKDAIAVAVMNAAGKVVMESILETKAAMLQFIRGLRGNLLITFEERTWAAWLYDLLKPHVSKVTVCHPRKNALLKSGNKGDRIDAQKLAELLRNGSLSAVYHGERGLRTLRELSLSYLTITNDLTRVMNRLKALYHSRLVGTYEPKSRFGTGYGHFRLGDITAMCDEPWSRYPLAEEYTLSSSSKFRFTQKK